MQFIAAGLLFLAGAIVVGLAFHDTVGQAWQVVSGGTSTSQNTTGASSTAKF